MKHLYKRTQQRGVALIVVLLLLALMTTIAANMAQRFTLSLGRSLQKVEHQQAFWYAFGVEQLAKYGIEQSFSESDTVNLSQPWALEDQVFPLDYGEARGQVLDKQACFNLNGLARLELTGAEQERPYLMQALISLLVQLDSDDYQAEVIVDSLYEFLDSDDSVVTISGVEEQTYEALTPAYMTATSLLADASELRAVYQVTPQIMQKSATMICALPTDNFRLNVNTLREWQAPLLSAMTLDELSATQAKELIENRPFDGWGSVDEFMSSPAVASLTDRVRQQLKAHLAVDSEYFELDTEILVGDSRVRVRSLLHSKDKQTAQVVRRRYGGIVERVSSVEVE